MPGAGWQQLPTPPSDTATVAFDPASSPEALAVEGTILQVWSLASRAHVWAHRQTLNVPHRVGSSE